MGAPCSHKIFRHVTVLLSHGAVPASAGGESSKPTPARDTFSRGANPQAPPCVGRLTITTNTASTMSIVFPTATCTRSDRLLRGFSSSSELFDRHGDQSRPLAANAVCDTALANPSRSPVPRHPPPSPMRLPSFTVLRPVAIRLAMITPNHDLRSPSLSFNDGGSSPSERCVSPSILTRRPENDGHRFGRTASYQSNSTHLAMTATVPARRRAHEPTSP